jgi:UDP-N-acetylglucosamine/UDP-N-acetylgalactosamine 4-epimerase
MSNLDQALSAAGVALNSEQFRFFEGDIGDSQLVEQALDGVEIVLHQAALGSVPRSIEDPLRSHQSNVNGFFILLNAARLAGIKRFVYASSSSVYGDSQQLPKVEQNIGNPLSPYAATKRIDEIYASSFASCYKMTLVGFRYFNVFGPRQDPSGPYAAVIPRWIEAVLSSRPCTVFGDGEQSRDFCYVENVVHANILAGLKDLAPGSHAVFNVAAAEQTTLLQLHEELSRLAAKHENLRLPVRPLEFAKERSGDVRHSLADLSAISDVLGYSVQTTFASGLEETFSWFVANSAAS